MGQGTFVCPTVFGVDPNNALHLIAADVGTNQMKVSIDGGASWNPDPTLTTLVTGIGQFRFNEPNFGIQAHAIAFDPANGNRILVGTEAAGIIASLDGGATWTTLFQSDQVGAITSFVFDEARNDVFVSSYGRGFWKLNFTPRPTTLTYTGDTSADFHDPALLSAVLTDPATTPASPVPGATITFTLGTQSCAATTDASGRAACVITPNQVPGSYTVNAADRGQRAAAGEQRVVPVHDHPRGDDARLHRRHGDRQRRHRSPRRRAQGGWRRPDHGADRLVHARKRRERTELLGDYRCLGNCVVRRQSGRAAARPGDGDGRLRRRCLLPALVGYEGDARLRLPGQWVVRPWRSERLWEP